MFWREDPTFWLVSKSLRGAIEHRMLGHTPRVSDSIDPVRLGPGAQVRGTCARMCISNKFLNDAEAAGWGPQDHCLD